jgi:hypothetical protein
MSGVTCVDIVLNFIQYLHCLVLSVWQVLAPMRSRV